MPYKSSHFFLSESVKIWNSDILTSSKGGCLLLSRIGNLIPFLWECHNVVHALRVSQYVVCVCMMWQSIGADVTLTYGASSTILINIFSTIILNVYSGFKFYSLLVKLKLLTEIEQKILNRGAPFQTALIPKEGHFVKLEKLLQNQKYLQ